MEKERPQLETRQLHTLKEMCMQKQPLRVKQQSFSSVHFKNFLVWKTMFSACFVTVENNLTDFEIWSDFIVTVK